jgi:hypothetical protein
MNETFATSGTKGGDSKVAPHYGKYRGTVTNNQDPNNLGRVKLKVAEILGDLESGWALPCTPYAGEHAGVYPVPPMGTGLWVEFEGGDVSRPIWVGGWWASGKLPTDEGGSSATPDLKIIRSEQGLMLALHDNKQTIALSDSRGANILRIEVHGGTVTLKATAKVVVDAPRIELAANASHPGVFGDKLLSYLAQIVGMFNAHIHPGQMAGSLPVTPAPPIPPLPQPGPDLVSMTVELG